MRLLSHANSVFVVHITGGPRREALGNVENAGGDTENVGGGAEDVGGDVAEGWRSFTDRQQIGTE
jgi:hypothetical protein